jgi:DNA-binding CsgD family transcriptional regulator/tetratricopeptide (TPR) repeat protein
LAKWGPIGGAMTEIRGVVRLVGASDEGPLFERERELQQLRDAVAGLERGAGSVLAIRGEPGLGKTALLNALVDEAAAAGFQTLAMTANPRERSLPWTVVRELIVPLSEFGPRGPVTFLADVNAPSGAEGVSSTLYALVRLVREHAQRVPMVLAVDDAHWCDEQSAVALGYIARRLAEFPLLLAIALRSSDPGARRVELRALVGGPRTMVILPRPLSPRACRALVAQRLGEPVADEFLVAFERATGGTPLKVVELLRELRADGARADGRAAGVVEEMGEEVVARVVLARLLNGSQECSDLAAAAAVLGPSGTVAQASRLARLDDHAGALAAEQLHADGILIQPNGLRFAHPLIGAAVEAGLSGSELDRLHRAAARLLSSDGVEVERVALHLLACEPVGEPWAHRALAQAGAAAAATGGMKAAAGLLRRALDEPLEAGARAELMCSLGAVEVHLSGAAGLPMLRDALAVVQEPVARVQMALRVAEQLGLFGAFPEAVDVLASIPSPGPGHDQLALALDGALILAGLMRADTFTAALERGSAYLDREPETFSDPGLLSALAYMRACITGPTGEGGDLAERAVGLSGGDLDAWTASLSVFALIANERLGVAVTACTDALRGAERSGRALLAALLLSLRSVVHLRAGRVTEAGEDATRAMVLARELETFVPVTIAAMLAALVERGDLSGAERLLREYVPSDGDRQAASYALVLNARGRIYAAKGQWRAALEEFGACGTLLKQVGVVQPAIVPWRSDAALAHASLGELEKARQLAGEQLALADQWDCQRARATALRAAAAAEDDARAVELLRAAARSAAGLAPLEHAHVLTDLGARLRRAGHRQEARVALRDALGAAAECGAGALVRRARRELVATGARPRRDAQSGPGALTSSELTVARMAAAGRTNREISEALVITVRTVEAHLTHTFRKLGISSRGELNRAIADHRAPRAGR